LISDYYYTVTETHNKTLSIAATGNNIQNKITVQLLPLQSKTMEGSQVTFKKRAVELVNTAKHTSYFSHASNF